MLTEKDYCDKDSSLALKEVGYIGQGTCYYDLEKEPNKLRHLGIQVITTRTAERLNYVLAVHLYEAQRFLREKHDMYVHICRPHMKNGRYVWSNEVVFCGCGVSSRGFFLSYEEALSEGVRESIKILQDEQKENN